MAYLTESEGMKMLFAQDVHSPLHSDLKSNPEDYRRSLESMLVSEGDVKNFPIDPKGFAVSSL
jgi:hypothetical protein